jgi:mRNA interferase MazF
MTLTPGEVVLIRIDFHQTQGGKLRPAVVLLDSGDDDFVAAPITSRSRASDFDVAIQYWREAGLNVPSTIRVHKCEFRQCE